MTQGRATHRPEPGDDLPPLPSERGVAPAADAIPVLDEEEPPEVGADAIPELESPDAPAENTAEERADGE